LNETWWIGEEQLDDDQRAIVAIEPKGNHIISGPPGSGKTNLLLLHAKAMILSARPNVLAIVFIRTLQEFVSLGGLEYQLPAGTLTTLARWATDFLYEHGVFIKPEGTFEEKRLQLIGAVEELIREKKLSGQYECLFLDEAQDYLPQEIAVFRQLGKNTFAAFDSRQKIYRSRDCYKILSKGAVEHPLRRHYRLGRNICRLADSIMANSDEGSLLGTSRYDEDARPSSVDAFRCKDLDEQADRIAERLQVQVKAYPDEMIGVICTQNETLDRIWDRLQRSSIASLSVKQSAGERTPFEHDKPICLCTVHSSKGLEFRALHIADCDDLGTWPNHRNLTYTAVTRAKTSLSLYYSDGLQGYLRQALQELAPKPKPPKLADLFPKGKK